MDVLIERCAGLDVHRDTVVATVRRPGPGGARRSETRTLTKMTGQLEALAEWLAAQDVSLVGMESTGIYWRPVYYVLEDRFPVWVINAEHLRNVPGRKTDVADSMWIAQLIEHGLVSPSFVPPPQCAAAARRDPARSPAHRGAYAGDPAPGEGVAGRRDQAHLGGLDDPR